MVQFLINIREFTYPVSRIVGGLIAVCPHRAEHAAGPFPCAGFEACSRQKRVTEGACSAQQHGGAEEIPTARCSADDSEVEVEQQRLDGMVEPAAAEAVPSRQPRKRRLQQQDGGWGLAGLLSREEDEV